MDYLSDLALDITKTPQEILLDKFNAVNSLQLTLDDFIVAPPQAVDNAIYGTNTTVVFSPKVTSKWYNSFTLYYSRMDIVSILDNDLVSIPRGSATMLSDLILQINEAYGINLRPEDYYDATLPAVDPLDPDAQTPVVLTIKPESYLFTGSYMLLLDRPVPNQDPATGESADIYVLVDQPFEPAMKHNIVCVTNIGDLISNFRFMRNAVTKTVVTIDKMFRLKNSDIAVLGNFEFRASIAGGTEQDYVVNSIVVDPSGVIKVATDGLFGSSQNMFYNHSQGSDYVYAIDKDNVIGTAPRQLYRYLQDGSIDAGFTTPSLLYVPKLVKECNDGKFYTVSDVYTAQWDNDGDPGTPTVPVSQIRIDRFNSDGTIDVLYTPTIIRSTGNAQPWPVVNIEPIQTGGLPNGLYILFKPSAAPSSTGEVPVINGIAMIPGGEPEYGFVPAVRLLQSGLINTAFDYTQKNLNATAVYNTVGSNMAQGDKALATIGDDLVFFTHRSNPLTNIAQRMPVRYSGFGNMQKISGDAYIESYRWTNAKDIYALSGGTIISSGVVKLLNPGGGWQEDQSVVVSYHGDTTAQGILYSAPLNISGNATIKQIIVVEV